MVQNTSATLQKSPRWLRSRTGILVLGLVAVFFFTYILAWWDVYRLSATYLEDADASYAEGRYLDALLGYEEFDQEKRLYVDYGGYIQVQRIWENDYAYPVPGQVARANARIDDIIYTRLTLDDAEQFVQENIGRYNSYMGLVYLRLGELYEADGRLSEAQDVYESFPDLFPDERELVERARVDLENLLEQQAD